MSALMALPPPRQGVVPTQSVEALQLLSGSAATLPAKVKADDKKNKGNAREAPDGPPAQPVPLDAFQRGQLVSADAHADQMQQMQMTSATFTIARPQELQPVPPPVAPPRSAPDRYQPNFSPSPQPGYSPAPAQPAFQQPFNGNPNLASQYAPQPAMAPPVSTGGQPVPPPKPKSKKPAAPPPQAAPAPGFPPARYDNNNYVSLSSFVKCYSFCLLIFSQFLFLLNSF